MPTTKNPTSSSGSSEKQILSFRLPKNLLEWLRVSSDVREWSVNEMVVRCLDGFRVWFGLPAAMAALLESDREAMGMDHYDYFAHLIGRRYDDIRSHGVGFEKKGEGGKSGKR
jgi:hypothetical protein